MRKRWTSRNAATSQIVNLSGYVSDASVLVHMAHRGIAFELGTGAQRLNPIHGADLAELWINRLGREPGERNVWGLTCTPSRRSWTWHLLLWANVLGRCASRCELFAPLCGPPIDWARGSRRWPDFSSEVCNVLDRRTTGTHYLDEHFDELALSRLKA
ncbi:MAG: hypothetical protein U5O16_25425 [Rhodococcus sp. (in: high G+C Gram-positive bacteria)]|uniref:hypothetical protein n=1 Tax=Rhodococcus sp. TaxID=1831 RepID=UPI002ADCF693|nr:hypothetical protein [Rhodococcus sp. (in: high G+C Gram-positive bacteria)]